MPDTPRPGHNHPLDSLCLVIACPRGAYDAGKAAHIDALTAAVEGERVPSARPVRRRVERRYQGRSRHPPGRAVIPSIDYLTCVIGGAILLAGSVVHVRGQAQCVGLRACVHWAGPVLSSAPYRALMSTPDYEGNQSDAFPSPSSGRCLLVIGDCRYCPGRNVRAGSEQPTYTPATTSSLRALGRTSASERVHYSGRPSGDLFLLTNGSDVANFSEHRLWARW